MKNTLVLLALSALFFASCNKEGNTLTPSNPQQSASIPSVERIGAVPSTFIQKVLLENFTSMTNGNCPINDYLINKSKAEHPGQVITASFHRNDILKTGATADLFTLTGSTNPLKIPSIMVNRLEVNNSYLIEDDSWKSFVTTELGNTPGCGLAIKSDFNATTNKMDIYIHAGFSANISGNYNVCIYLIEDNVQNTEPIYAQANSYNNDILSPFYQAGNPIPSYVYNNVLRKTITSVTGFPIPGTCQLTGGQMIHRFASILPQSANPDNCSIVAFIYDTATLRVMNVQQAKLGTIKDWN